MRRIKDIVGPPTIVEGGIGRDIEYSDTDYGWTNTPTAAAAEADPPTITSI